MESDGVTPVGFPPPSLKTRSELNMEPLVKRPRCGKPWPPMPPRMLHEADSASRTRMTMAGAEQIDRTDLALLNADQRKLFDRITGLLGILYPGWDFPRSSVAICCDSSATIQAAFALGGPFTKRTLQKHALLPSSGDCATCATDIDCRARLGDCKLDYCTHSGRLRISWTSAGITTPMDVHPVPPPEVLRDLCARRRGGG